MLKADELQYNTVQIEPGKWVVARPVKQNFKNRLKDAVEVLKGNAEAVTFHKQ